MNYNDDDTATADPGWCNYYSGGAVAAEAEAAAANNDNFAGTMTGGGYSTSIDELFELVSRGICCSGDGSSGQPAVGLPPPQFMQPPHVPDEQAPPAIAADPPSEDVMASWLYEIVRGGDDRGACDRDDNGGFQQTPLKESNQSSSIKVVCSTKEMAPIGSSERMATTGGGRRSRHCEAHNQCEKRRRWKINEKLKTLQQLVPGCNKSNHAATLEQTITYMKSLQHQVQAGPMPVVDWPVRPSPSAAAAAAAAYPMMAALGPPQMVAFGRPMLHYPPAAMMMPAAAAALSMYPPPAPPAVDGRSRQHPHDSSTSSSWGSCCGKEENC